MGFRSTFCTSDSPIEWPAWFREKYDGILNLPAKAGPLYSIYGGKTYRAFAQLHEDIQKAVPWDTGNAPSALVLIYLHECGGITRCQIESDRILWSEPDGWRLTDGIEHDYCYGCSDAQRLV